MYVSTMYNLYPREYIAIIAGTATVIYKLYKRKINILREE